MMRGSQICLQNIIRQTYEGLRQPFCHIRQGFANCARPSSDAPAALTASLAYASHECACQLKACIKFFLLQTDCHKQMSPEGTYSQSSGMTVSYLTLLHWPDCNWCQKPNSVRAHCQVNYDTFAVHSPRVTFWIQSMSCTPTGTPLDACASAQQVQSFDVCCGLCVTMPIACTP